jgi:hypothetical protein
MPAMMSPSALKALLQAEKSDALGGSFTGTGPKSNELAFQRSRAMDYYYGDVSADMPVADGHSKAVSTDVSDTVEGLMPVLMDIFASGEEVVKFEPIGIEDEAAAEQEGDYVNYVFMQKNPGFLVLYSFIKDALLSKNGFVKVTWSEEKREERETYENQPEQVFAVLVAQPDIEVVDHTEHKDEGPSGEILHDITVVHRSTYKCAKVESVPPEEFGISRYARSIKDATYCYHQTPNLTQSDLISQGYDAAQIRKLPSTGMAMSEEDQARDTVEKDRAAADTVNKATRRILVTEHYVVMDYDDDGAKLYRVTTGGDELEVLTRKGEPDVHLVDEMPFASATPIPVTHRFYGRSIADLVIDIQQIKTALLRSLLTNAYLSNNSRLELAESHAHERTLDDLLVNRPGGVVRTKLPGGLVPIPNQPIGNFAFPLIEYIDATREWRTGVTRQGQGINADALQNQSATAVAQVFTAAQARVKLIARILAETGIRDLFALLHGVIRKNDRQVNTTRLRNKWVPVDPRNWKTREDMTINVGLGTGSTQEQVQHLMMILGLQKEAIQMPQLGLVTPQNMYATADKLCQKMGLKSAQPYFTEPSQNPQAGQQPPDPKMIEAQGKLEIEKQKAGTQMQLEQVKHQANVQSETVKAQADITLKREQMQIEFQLKREQMTAELALKREQMMMEAQLKRESGYYTPKSNSAGIERVRMGGEVG